MNLCTQFLIFLIKKIIQLFNFLKGNLGWILHVLLYYEPKINYRCTKEKIFFSFNVFNFLDVERLEAERSKTEKCLHVYCKFIIISLYLKIFQQKIGLLQKEVIYS